jgi:exosortase D (VPLPA-CTERM-specific)
MTFMAEDNRQILTTRISTVLSAIVAIGCFVAFFWEGLSSLLKAWSRPEYSHGYLILPIAVFLLLRKIREPSYLNTAPDGRLGGFITVTFGMLLGLFGNLASVPDITTYGMLVCIAGLVIVVVGLRRGIQLWPAWLYLFFMLPLPNFIYWPLSIRLQFLSSEIGVKIIQLLDIPVYLDGNIIDLGNYKLQVAEACSGLRYLFPLMSFGFLFAILYVGNLWQKAILFLSTIPITIGMNSLRIAVIGVLVNGYGTEQAEGFLHFFEGWVIFILCILLLYAEAKLLRLLAPKDSKSQALLDIELHGSLAGLEGWKSYQAEKFFIASALAMALGLGLWLGFTGRPVESFARRPLVEFPMVSGEWSGKTTMLSPDVEKVLAADDYLLADFNSSAGRPPVNLLVSYYASQTRGSGVHSPEVCLPAGGWEVSKWGQATVVAGATPVTLSVNRAIIQKGQDRQLVYYWFEQRGRHLSGDYMAKAYTVMDSISRGRSDGALVRVVTPIAGKDVEVADQRLREFLGFAVAELPAFVPP